jgi:phage N-6-adenine-methyltransferase
MNSVLFSSATDEWSTPQVFFNRLNRRYNFTLDSCATPENAKCPIFFTREQDGLKQDWGTHRVFCNPPYGRTMGAWARKCFEASQGGALVVLLVPSRTDTRWYHDWIEDKAEVTFLRGRLRFGGATTSAPFPSMLCVYRPNRSMVTCAHCGDKFIARSDARACSNRCRQALYRQRSEPRPQPSQKPCDRSHASSFVRPENSLRFLTFSASAALFGHIAGGTPLKPQGCIWAYRAR